MTPGASVRLPAPGVQALFRYTIGGLINDKVIKLYDEEQICSKESIKDEINKIRKKLNNLISDIYHTDGLNDEILQLSRDLDEIIVKYYRLK